MERERSIEANAAYWLVRRSDERERVATEALFRQWLAADLRHQGAYLRLQAVDARLARLRPGTGAREKAKLRFSASRLRRPLAGALAACLLLSIGVGGILWPRSVEMETALGEQRRSVLADGSSVELNTATHLLIDLSPALRVVRLESGEALFQVAKDKSRPFVVRTPLADVRAVGTAFTVNIEGGDLLVAVSEGVVSVERTGKELARVPAGQSFRLAPDGQSRQEEHPAAEIERLQSWRSGWLVFSGETLAAATATFNRYNRLQIDIPDQEIAALQVGGSFRATDPVGFTEALARSFSLSVHKQGERLVLGARQGQNATDRSKGAENNSSQ